MSEPIAVMRNRVTTEFRKVAPASEEYLELQAMRDPNDGLPVWEETSLPNAVEQSKRLEANDPLPSDIGDSAGPVGRLTGAHETYTPAGDVREQLPSEREAGVEQDETTHPRLPLREDHIEEVPLTAAMDSPTDTDVSGTQPELEGSSSGASGSKMKKSGSKKKDEEASAQKAAEQKES